MKVVCSNLAMRFYVKDGWTIEKLNLMLESGKFLMPHPNDTSPYFIMEVGSKVNMSKLMTVVTKVERTFNDYPNISDQEFLEKFNW